MSVESLITSHECWAEAAVNALQNCIAARLREAGHCSVMLTGGHSATQLYVSWARHSDFRTLTGVDFYFGDERCVPLDHQESNYGMAMRVLFAAGVPRGCRVHRMEADSEDVEKAADRYAAILPKRIDCLLLSVGLDGHIASLFPHSSALTEASRRVDVIHDAKYSYERMTITSSVILQADQVFVMAVGSQKRSIYEEALRNPSDIYTLPARLVMNGTWIFG